MSAARATLQQDVGRKRQRLDGQEQALAMGRALYQENLQRRADLECCMLVHAESAAP